MPNLMLHFKMLFQGLLRLLMVSVYCWLSAGFQHTTVQHTTVQHTTVQHTTVQHCNHLHRNPSPARWYLIPPTNFTKQLTLSQCRVGERHGCQQGRLRCAMAAEAAAEVELHVLLQCRQIWKIVYSQLKTLRLGSVDALLALQCEV
jgi:hypothetical protein